MYINTPISSTWNHFVENNFQDICLQNEFTWGFFFYLKKCHSSTRYRISLQNKICKSEQEKKIAEFVPEQGKAPQSERMCFPDEILAIRMKIVARTFTVRMENRVRQYSRPRKEENSSGKRV